MLARHARHGGLELLARAAKRRQLGVQALAKRGELLVAPGAHFLDLRPGLGSQRAVPLVESLQLQRDLRFHGGDPLVAFCAHLFDSRPSFGGQRAILLVENLQLQRDLRFRLGEPALHLAAHLIQACVQGVDHGFHHLAVERSGRAGRQRGGGLLQPQQAPLEILDPVACQRRFVRIRRGGLPDRALG